MASSATVIYVINVMIWKIQATCFFIGSFVRPSVMRRASYMGSQKWQILPFISPLTFPSHFSPLNSHFPHLLFTLQLLLSPLTFHPLTHFPLSLFTPPLTFFQLVTPELSFCPINLAPQLSLPLKDHF